MREGWSGDDYLVLFEEDESRLRDAYGLSGALPEHRLIALRSWDDFIVENDRGARFTIPTVPTDVKYLAPFALSDGLPLSVDAKVRGRIKWYVTPLVFGGDPNRADNLTWVPLDQHAQLVAWWNQKYRDLRRGR